MTFRVYDSVGNCVSEFTGTMSEWQRDVAPALTKGRRGFDGGGTGSFIN